MNELPLTGLTVVATSVDSEEMVLVFDNGAVMRIKGDCTYEWE